MRLTVSGTTMMNPLLHVDNHPPCASAPTRVTGLLENDHVQPGPNAELKKYVQYSQPDWNQVMLQSAKWQDFILLHNAKNTACAAVFDFKFDGTNAWYQLWNKTSNQACWLMNNDDMNYEPYAILTMDALVSLLPNWDGTLHQSPHATNKNTSVSDHHHHTIDAKQILGLSICDASTSAAGQLWFHVTVESNSGWHKMGLDTMPTQSGWISHRI